VLCDRSQIDGDFNGGSTVFILQVDCSDIFVSVITNQIFSLYVCDWRIVSSGEVFGWDLLHKSLSEQLFFFNLDLISQAFHRKVIIIYILLFCFAFSLKKKTVLLFLGCIVMRIRKLSLLPSTV